MICILPSSTPRHWGNPQSMLNGLLSAVAWRLRGQKGKERKRHIGGAPRRSGGGGKEEGGREKREGKGENKVKQEKGRGWTGRGRG